MINVPLEGTTRRIGKSQGYKGLSVKDFDLDGIPAMQTGWELTPGEVEKIKQGGKIIITLLGNAHPLIMVEIK